MSNYEVGHAGIRYYICWVSSGLERAPRDDGAQERLYEIHSGSYPDLLPGTLALLDELRAAGVKVAIGSSSKNHPYCDPTLGHC